MLIQRDGTGRLLRILEPSGRALEATYSGARLTQLRDPLGREVRYTYDGAHRLLTITDPRGIVFLTNTYSASGRCTTATMGPGASPLPLRRPPHRVQ
ncbi:MAG: hypothetical protein L0214_13355 [candidate division NC10 bacterium]|nr:hypothetical protein [candidate division NC10 bacterium]